MELGATMELGGRRGSQQEEEDTPYIVEEQIQPLSSNSACAAVLPHLRRGTTAGARCTTAGPRGTTAHAAETGTTQNALRQRAAVLLVRYYLKAGTVQRWEDTDIINYIHGYFRRVGVDAKTRRGSTISQQRYYRAGHGCKKLHPPLTAAYLRN